MAAGLREELMRNLARWQDELAEDALAGTHIGGIAGKAVGQFEGYFRAVLARYCSRFSIDYGAEVRPKLGKKGKALADLTLGELVQCSGILNQRLTRCLRSQTQPSKQYLVSRRLVSQQDEELLVKINNRRVKLVHDRQEFDKRLRRNASELVNWISQAMAVPFFELAEFDDP